MSTAAARKLLSFLETGVENFGGGSTAGPPLECWTDVGGSLLALLLPLRTPVRFGI